MHPGIHAERTPDKPAYIMADSGEAVSYRQLNDASNQGAQLFRRLGLKPGDGVAIFMENNAAYFKLCWAAHRAGLYYTCISSHLTAPEVDFIVQDCGARVFITSAAQAGYPEPSSSTPCPSTSSASRVGIAAKRNVFQRDRFVFLPAMTRSIASVVRLVDAIG